jgi:hypothetical protein
MWKNIAGWSGSVLSSTMRITGELLKWGTLLGGGLIGGSLFGITRMASDVSNYRRTARGLGLSIGGLRSFSINESRFVDPGSFLSSVNQAVSNPALQGPLYSLGVNPNGSTEQVSLSMLRAMRRLALSTPRGELGLISQSYGLGPYGGLETLLRLRSTSASEFYKQQLAEGRDRTGLGLPPGVARKWQDFSSQMDRAGASIFKTFVLGLAPLAGPLTKLSGAFTGFLQKLMSGPLLRGGIDKLADWLNKFSVELASQKFQAAVSSLVSDTGTIAKGLHFLADEIRLYMGWRHPGKEVGKFGASVGHALFGGGSGLPMLSAAGRTMSRSQIIAASNQLDSMLGFAPGTMRRLVATESSFNPNAVSGKGAEGLTQLMPGTAWSYGLRGNMALDPMKNLAAGANYLASLVRHYHGDMQEALAAYNLGPHKFDTKYGGRVSALPKSVRSYVTAISSDSNIVVTARHKTGGNPVLAGAGLAGAP